MGFIDKVDNKWKHMNSKRSENSEVDEIRKKIEAENEMIKEQIVLIGQHFWNLYANGQYVPTDDMPLFEKIDDCNSNIRLLTIQADDCKIKGIQDRERIDEETRERIEKKQAEAEAKRQRKEEERASKKASKDAEREFEDF